MAVVLVVVFVVPFPHTHQIVLSLTSASNPPSCGEELLPETFPSWFVGTASVSWTSTEAIVFWINEAVGNNSGLPVLYNGSGEHGAGSFPISDHEAFRFGMENCQQALALVNVTLAVPYSAPLV